MTATSTADVLFDEASGWYFRLQAEDVTPADMDAFAAWLGQGPAQDDAWQEVQAMLGGLREPARVIRRAEQAAWRKPARAWQRCACAAAVLLAVGLTVQNTPWLDRLRADYTTGTGESRSIELADGSHLQLNTDSAVQIRLSGGERQIRLLRGEGFFDVTKDSTRPFVVQSGDGWVKVVGTQFSVARRDAQTRVQVAQGKVQVSAGSGEPVYLEPGRAVEYQGQRLAEVHAFDPASGFAWRQRQLVFRQQPLSEVVSELNRYWPGKTLVLGDALRNRVVSGVFEIDKPEAVIKALEYTLNLRAEHYTPYLLVLREGKAS
ncbi:FecR family protein [Pseudomonas poae]|uniref:FecR family protein n=1 Tax=Pseudomonas poae TaxID=200451 RepID=A0A7Z1K166_9PSED|nr:MULTISPECIES: FecR family protein [Pseudomonas]HAA41520.1 FecR family protein [Pseudomonas sp.]NMZ92127.1 FecR family protein [Pseudomonas marginalis]PFG60896.1 FecR family protein [Pseudomonas poae]PUB46846.1 FecR family protein [Pseudomonas sp. GV047]SMF54581.1 FecR family protein [Pseudomonas sp. LAMO17WK12:I1]